ncbi:hypothetical protein EDB84DRAFT_1290 [Lactarius hengduanensis]|nr:hypothetical protein EDB84DRAFT_1290 [Lactarius hengduanensis]
MAEQQCHSRWHPLLQVCAFLSCFLTQACIHTSFIGSTSRFLSFLCTHPIFASFRVDENTGQEDLAISSAYPYGRELYQFRRDTSDAADSRTQQLYLIGLCRRVWWILRLRSIAILGINLQVLLQVLKDLNVLILQSSRLLNLLQPP